MLFDPSLTKYLPVGMPNPKCEVIQLQYDNFTHDFN